MSVWGLLTSLCGGDDLSAVSVVLRKINDTLFTGAEK